MQAALGLGLLGEVGGHQVMVREQPGRVVIPEDSEVPPAVLAAVVAVAVVREAAVVAVAVPLVPRVVLAAQGLV